MAHQVKRVRRKRRHHRPRARIFTGRKAIYLGAAVFGLLFGLLFLNYGPRTYRTWRESRLQHRASELLQKNDLEGATQAAREMLSIQPESVAAFQILADATERQNKPETVAWRAQIARIFPHNLDAQLNLASAALRFSQLDTVRHALEKVDPEDREKAAYHVVAGWLARAEGNDAAVEEHFAAAVEEEPGNDLYQFNFAILQIRSPDPEKNSSARETLERLSKVPGYRAGSLRALLTDAVQRNDLQGADELAQNLQMNQQVTFADYLLCLEFYRKLDEKKFAALLEKVKPVAARDPASVGQLMEWMNRNGLASEVLKWNEKLPSELTTHPPAAVAIADAFAAVKNWSRLKRWTRSANWGEFEYLRFAYQAFAARQSRQSAAEAEFDSLWQSAERAANEHPDHEAMLARLATKWSLTSEATTLWKRVTKDARLRREALDALFKTYRASNELPELLQIAKQLHENSPHEGSLACTYARLALLLAPTTEDGQRVAKEAHEAAPTDVNCAVTYAFALYGTGRTSEGLEILRNLPNEQLHDPHAAVYVALLFLDNYEPEAAREFIEAAQKGPLYLEEKKLLGEAIAKISVPASSSGGASLLDNLSLPIPSVTPRPASSPLPTTNKIEPPGSTPVVHPLLRDDGG
ncbi:MAG: hypothetical protein M3119_02220 [Verrucomicrobiota bacterium]|nr:hypothetical protein [Verrucomicrobiota bacterium]